MTVRVWCGKSKQQLFVADLGVKGRVLSYSNDGTRIAVGTITGDLFDLLRYVTHKRMSLHAGQVRILSSDLKLEINEMSISASRIDAIAYSPDGSTLAVAAHDHIIYLLDAKTYNSVAHCTGHSSHVTALDFSLDSKVIQSSSRNYELLFWNSKVCTYYIFPPPLPLPQ
jgi:WD40 repeat protein